ncbi:GntR family transcriptional regulator [Candidatus Latescibacterota bacterium]
MNKKLDPTRPIYIQIMEEIKKRTVRGHYKSGEKLPSVRELARITEVNPNTIARVYMELERDGFIFTKRGQGSFITEDSTRVAEERKRLADHAAEKFINEIGELKLNESHRKKILDSIAGEFSELDNNKKEKK